MKTILQNPAGANPSSLGHSGPELLRPSQVADRWQTTTQYLAKLRSAGLGPAYLKLNGSRIMYKATDVLAYEDGYRIATLEAVAQ